MLSSIHPLGERARHNRYGTTVTAFVAGATTGGTAAGAAAGAIGAVLGPADASPLLVLGVVVAALVLDLRPGGIRPPTTRRQVNEDWLVRYRGWVYGAAFGFQLGMGVVTVVTTAAVYAMLVLAFATGSAAGGAVVGIVFGAVRGLAILPGAWVRDPRALRSFHRAMAAGAPAAHRLSVAGMAVIGALLTATVVS